MNQKDYKLTTLPLVMMVFSTVYGFANVPRAYLMMGYGAIFWYILAALVYFLPYAVMMVEFGSAFSREKGGIYSWMNKSMGERYAFIVVFMWYASYIAWFVSTSTILWVPVARVLNLFNFGGGLTPLIDALNQNSYVIGICAIIFVMKVSFFVGRGFKSVGRVASIGGMCVVFLNLLLIVCGFWVLFLNKFNFAEPITSMSNFVVNPHKASSPFSLLAFITFAIFAYGGLEVVSGIVDKVEKPEKTFPRGLILSALIIALGYSVMIFVVGMFTNWLGVMDQGGVNLGNALYVVMEELGAQLGMALGMRQAGALMMSRIFSGVVAMSMLLTYIGAFFAYFYSPLKQLIEGTPERIWPKFLLRKKNEMPVGAIYLQGSVVVAMLAINTFGGSGATELMNRLVMMTNVAMTLPYLFIGLAYLQFRRNNSLVKGFLMVKNNNLAIIISVFLILFVGFANLFTILQPMIQAKGAGNMMNGVADTVMLGMGPILFCFVAYWLYSRSLKKS
ncbi:MAG: glutamate/gamma-aminobutyrate family transporter YjeM [Spirochaetia bacterium]